MAQTLLGGLSRPTLQSEKKNIYGSENVEIPYFQVHFLHFLPQDKNSW